MGIIFSKNRDQEHKQGQEQERGNITKTQSGCPDAPRISERTFISKIQVPKPSSKCASTGRTRSSRVSKPAKKRTSRSNGRENILSRLSGFSRRGEEEMAKITEAQIASVALSPLKRAIPSNINLRRSKRLAEKRAHAS